MPRDPEVYVRDMLGAIAAIREYVAGLDEDAFRSDQRTVDAVARNLEVLGEAAKSIPPGLRARHPTIEWRKIAGLRDVIIHQYFVVDLTIVWEIVTTKLDDLEAGLRQILVDVRRRRDDS